MKLTTEQRQAAKPLPCFKPELRQAIRDGRKTQTRRPIKPQPIAIRERGMRWQWSPNEDQYPILKWRDNVNIRCRACSEWAKRSSYQPGDICYLREPIARILGTKDETGRDPDSIVYKDDGQFRFLSNSNTFTGKLWDAGVDEARCQIETLSDWHRNSVNFPKWTARTFVKITDVRVEKLGDISEQDAIAEGCSHTGMFGIAADEIETAKEQFTRLWQDCYGEWTPNLWVWVYEWELME